MYTIKLALFLKKIGRIVEDIKTKEKKKMKIRIDGGSFSFSEVNDKEWEAISVTNI